ncbi:hypothetical protein ACJX0J_021024, partial [Zea mays]
IRDPFEKKSLGLLETISFYEFGVGDSAHEIITDAKELIFLSLLILEMKETQAH